jgi:alkanesulfonate monooxygenase SsuD/methylene tetrahydromethanopterin reductase-like flavin-dependent oxidoreductase (luciferase family)
MAHRPLRLGVVYDFRNPPDSGIATPALYAEIVEQVAWLDGLGLDLVWFTEHHFVDDGYLPSWTPVAGAMAARTRRVRFSSDICLLPFSHPIRLAEDLAVLDNLSGGRVEIGVGMGYAPHEFRGFGIPLPQRRSRTEEGLEVLRRCFSGERFSFHGQRYHFDDVLIRPGYVQPGGPPLWLAAMSRAGAERAARYDCHLLPQGPREDVLDPWLGALAASGRDPAAYRVGIIRSCLVTDDPERDWPPVRAAERYRGELYSRFFAEAGRFQAVDWRGARIPQTWVVGDAEHCATQLSSFIAAHGITDLVTWAVPPGLRPEQMNSSLERFARDVAPRLRAADAVADRSAVKLPKGD